MKKFWVDFFLFLVQARKNKTFCINYSVKSASSPCHSAWIWASSSLLRLKAKPEAAAGVLTTVHGLVSNRNEVTRLVRASYVPAQPRRAAAPARDPLWEALPFILPAALQEASDVPCCHWHLEDPPPSPWALTSRGKLCSLQTHDVFRCFLSASSWGLCTRAPAHTLFYWELNKMKQSLLLHLNMRICGKRTRGKSLLNCSLPTIDPVSSVRARCCRKGGSFHLFC